MTTENRTGDRRTNASEVKHLSILESRCKIRRQQVQKLNTEFAFSKVQFAVSAVGLIASYILVISEVVK